MWDSLKYGSWTLKDVADFWDSVSDYEETSLNTFSYFRRFIDGYRLSSKQYFKKNVKILDICSRTGIGSSFFNKKHPGMKFTCMDVSPEFKKKASVRLKREKVNFKYVLFDSYKLPLKDNEFDHILCFETLEHVDKPDVFLAELSRVLKKDGEILITTPNTLWDFVHWTADKLNIHFGEGPHRFIPRKELHRIIRRAGFRIIKEETTVLIPYGPKFLTDFGLFLEKTFRKSLMPYLGLRRIFVCRKMKSPGRTVYNFVTF